MASCDTQAAHQDDEVLHLFRDTLVVELGAEARRLFVLAAIAAKAAHPAALDGFEFLVEDHLVIPSSAVAERVVAPLDGASECARRFVVRRRDEGDPRWRRRAVSTDPVTRRRCVGYVAVVRGHKVVGREPRPAALHEHLPKDRVGMHLSPVLEVVRKAVRVRELAIAVVRAHLPAADYVERLGEDDLILPARRPVEGVRRPIDGAVECACRRFVRHRLEPLP
mmetsp:Transcript_12591/g.32991  ORF Transcript_12591/g.32991 Transcript_12591/m.32991 type:complete len:223 (-) Transcript_12591:397-1065(-)